jgi:hypothetical protein
LTNALSFDLISSYHLISIEDHGPMAHDSVKTQRYVSDALARYASVRDPVKQNLSAFAYLRGLRRRGDEPLLAQLHITVPDIPTAPFDESLADAEHYMFARLLASETGDPAVKALTTGYELKKFVDSKLGKEQEMRTNPRFPVLPPSLDSIKWGLQGAEEGLRQYRDAHGGKGGKVGSAVQANADFIKGTYRPKYGHSY